jgi:uncharacterized membrane protein
MRKNHLIGLLTLLGFFVGFAGLIGHSYSTKLQATTQRVRATQAQGKRVIGPIPVINGVCHMFFPASAVDRVMLHVVCPSCGRRARRLREDYRLTLANGLRCSPHGQNRLTFTCRED